MSESTSSTIDKFKLFFRHNLTIRYILLGQLMSVFIFGTAITSDHLVVKCNLSTPNFQSIFTYLTLFIGATIVNLAIYKRNIFQIFKKKWWQLLLFCLFDTEANFLYVLAYRYTSAASVQVDQNDLYFNDFIVVGYFDYSICCNIFYCIFQSSI